MCTLYPTVVVIFLGFEFDRVEKVDDGARHASYAHIAIHSTLMLILEGIKLWKQFKGLMVIAYVTSISFFKKLAAFSFCHCA